ncbi:hypothetical protein VSS74_07240 [Conexibacter stalactiti]|uniref:Ig-like domain-containing protein n=1 Tax=Conexibacter stalactiti TaxID=1940611 RepID=A0ABU4HLD5_9ACTN|nr:hypothetical protein [Conexibacter stalactiti]MDW5594123.1 hypothetical protein [Conexibacter stalactiti]MEC5034765.1 hypothetical protein [Conexibacter stalactiti]
MRSIRRALTTAALALAGALALAPPAGAQAEVTPRVWALSVAAEAEALVGEPLEALATVRDPDACAGLKRAWGCLHGGASAVAGRGAGDGAAREPGASACLAAGGVQTRCQGWGDTGVEFKLYGPDDPTCALRPLLHRYVALTAAGAGSYASGPFVPEQAGTYRWTVAIADSDNTAPPVGCADAAVVTVAQVPSMPPEQPPAEPGPPPAVVPAPDLPRGDPGAPPTAAAPPAAPVAPAARTAIERLALSARCARPATGGRVAGAVELTAAHAGPVQVRVERALGTRGRERCPAAGGRGRFDGRFRTVTTLRRDLGGGAAARAASSAPRAAATNARAAAGARRLTLNLRLEPALYRITVRAVGDGGRLSAPKRRFLRVLVAR